MHCQLLAFLASILGFVLLTSASANSSLSENSTFSYIDRSSPHAAPPHYYTFNGGSSSDTPARLSKHGVGGQHFCEGANWTCVCGSSCCTKNFCLNYVPVSFNKVSSVGPNPDTVCWFFEYVFASCISAHCPPAPCLLSLNVCVRGLG